MHTKTVEALLSSIFSEDEVKAVLTSLGLPMHVSGGPFNFSAIGVLEDNNFGHILVLTNIGSTSSVVGEKDLEASSTKMCRFWNG